MATPSNILACRTPWTEEPGKLQSIGLQRDGHDWAIEHVCLPITEAKEEITVVF